VREAFGFGGLPEGGEGKLVRSDHLVLLDVHFAIVIITLHSNALLFVVK
jgi:hypothetical protein